RKMRSQRTAAAPTIATAAEQSKAEGGCRWRLFAQTLGFGDAPYVASEEFLNGQDQLPVVVGKRDLGSLFIPLNVFRGLAEVMMEKIKNFRQARCLGRRQLLRQRRQRRVADEEVVIGSRPFLPDIEIKVVISIGAARH